MSFAYTILACCKLSSYISFFYDSLIRSSWLPKTSPNSLHINSLYEGSLPGTLVLSHIPPTLPTPSWCPVMNECMLKGATACYSRSTVCYLWEKPLQVVWVCLSVSQAGSYRVCSGRLGRIRLFWPFETLSLDLLGM